MTEFGDKVRAYFDSLITPEQVPQVARGVIEGCA